MYICIYVYMIVIHNIHISMYICMHMSSCMCICVTPLATHPQWYGMLFSDVWSYTSVSSWISSELSYLPILLLYPSSSQWHDRVPELELELNSNCPASPRKKETSPFSELNSNWPLSITTLTTFFPMSRRSSRLLWAPPRTSRFEQNWRSYPWELLIEGITPILIN